MGRLESVDGLRGACLVFMTLTHLHFGRDYLLGHLHPRELGFADSAQAFIFLSGLLVGATGIRQHRKGGPASVGRRLRRRALELYGWHLGLVLAVLLASRLLPDAAPAWGDWLRLLLDDGGAAAALATAALLHQPTYLDILPQYVLYLLLAPAALGLVAQGRAGLVAAASAVAWVAAQAGLHAEVLPLLAAAGAPLRSYFNPLAWQLVFFAGLLVGALGERGPARRADLLLRPGLRVLPQIALVLALALAALRLLHTFDLLGPATATRLAGLARKEDLGLLPTLSFAALAYLIAWLLAAAGAREGSVATRRVGLVLRALLAHPRMVALGRQALPVFAYHVLLVYALRYADARLGQVPDPWFSLAAAAAIASLFLLAAALDARPAASSVRRPRSPAVLGRTPSSTVPAPGTFTPPAA